MIDIGFTAERDNTMNRLSFIQHASKQYLISHSCQGNLEAIVFGQILYKDDLMRRFSLEKDETEASLVLELYAKNGIAGIEQLEGEIVFVLWDGYRRRILAYRDPCGSWPLFWSASKKMISISTSLRRLALRRNGSKVDLHYISEYLMHPNPHTELPCERTAFEGVKRVLPGTLLKIDERGSVVQHRYWDWAKNTQHEQNSPIQEAAEEFSRLFKNAVRERTKLRPVAAHLSGGMDSSSVVFTARDHLVSNSDSLHTLSLVYQEGSLAGEREYIELITNHTSNIIPHFLPGDKASDFAWFDRPIPVHDEPYAGLPSLALYREPVATAAQIGAKTILTGHGADEILGRAPLYIADLMRRGKFIAAVKESQLWAYALNKGFWSTMKRFTLEPLFPVLLREGLTCLSRNGFGRWPKLGWFAIPPWIRPEFARSYQLKQLGIRNANRMYGCPILSSIERHILENSAGDWTRWHLSAPHGIMISHPFKDPRLVCYALKYASLYRQDPTKCKPVLQLAMKERLPKRISTRKDKRGFDGVYGSGLVKNLTFLEHMVRASGLNELGIIDTDKLVDVMQQAAMGIGDLRARERMDKTLALIAWFDRLTSADRKSVSIEYPVNGASPTIRY